jgi:hypothetical protein
MTTKKIFKLSILISSYFLIYPFYSAKFYDSRNKYETTVDAGQHFLMSSRHEVDWDVNNKRWWLKSADMPMNYYFPRKELTNSNINITKTIYVYIISVLFLFVVLSSAFKAIDLPIIKKNLHSINKARSKKII